MNLEECFKTLDISPGASIDEIERAYRQLVKVWHPDRFPHDVELSEKANQKLKMINDAYATLKSGSGERAVSRPVTSVLACTTARRGFLLSAMVPRSFVEGAYKGFTAESGYR